MRPFGCMELWAGNERAHRSLELAGLEATSSPCPPEVTKAAIFRQYFPAATVSPRGSRGLRRPRIYGGWCRPPRPPLIANSKTFETRRAAECADDAFTLSMKHRTVPLRLTTVVTEPSTASAANLTLLMRRTRGCFSGASARSDFGVAEGLEGLPWGTSRRNLQSTRACG